MLKLQLRNKPSSAMWLVKESTTVGSHADCDFVISSNAVADRHIKLLVSHDSVSLEDSGHGKTTFVNDIPVGEYGPLKHGDVIKLSDTELEIIDPKQVAKANNPANSQNAFQKHWKLCASGDWLNGQEYEIDDSKTLGRDPQCDITIAGTYLSRRHADLTPSPEGLIITDLDSANGTYLNGEKVEKAVAKPGDELRFDTLKFTVTAPSYYTANQEQDEDDSNKTIMRPITPVSPNNSVSTSGSNRENNEEKRWKTKPTSVGNRPGEEPVEIKESSLGIWLYLAAGVAIAGATAAFLMVS